MPQDIYGAAATSNGVFSYALGGYSTSTGTTLDTFYRYNPVNERWETRPAMPDAVAMASAVYYPTTDKIYVFGGFDPNTGVFSDATRVFDLTTGTWGPAANMPGPRAFMASGYNAANGKIYLVGGSDAVDPSSARATTWEYDPAANTFTTRAPIPHAVRGSAFGVIGGHLYLAGGRDALGDVVDLVWDYSIAANTWTAKAAMPSPTNAAGSAAASGKLWSFGGESASGPVQTTAAYDPVTNTWASGPIATR
jgi:N-acetylneuraminic acid mutarotase